MKQFIQKINLLSIFMFVACALFGVMDASALMAAAPVVTPTPGANGNPVSVVVTEAPLQTDTINEESHELIQASVDQMITKMRPALTPLDTIMRQCKAKKAESQTFRWYSTDIRSVESSISNKVDGSTEGGFKHATVTVDNGGLFAVSDTLVVPSVKGADGADLVLYVVGRTGNDLDVVAINGTDSSGTIEVPEISGSSAVFRLSRAAAEGDVKTASYAAVPTSEENYCQIFKLQIAMSTLAQASKKEVGWDLSEVEEQALYEFRMAMEASALFGVKGKVFDNVKGAYVYTTGGIVPSIKNKIELGAGGDQPLSNADLIALCKRVFQGNVGSRKRVMFVGSEFNEALSTIETVHKQLEAGNTVVAWGLEFNEIRSNFGSLMVMQHDMLDLYGYSDKAIILDPDFIDKWTWMPMTSLELDTRKSGEYDGDVKVWTEISGFATRYPSCHAIVSLKA